MDFDSNLSKLQGALLSLGGRAMLNSAGSTDAVVDLLKDIIQGLSESEIFKITFFMVLNTDLSICQELKNDENVGLMTHITPVIEKSYLIDYLYKLNIQSHLNTIIANYPSALTLELVDVYVKKLKEASFHKNEYGVDYMYNLWRALFMKTWRIEKNSDCDDGSKMFVSAFEELYFLIQQVIVTSMKIGGEKLESFIGRNLYNLFDAVWFCLDLLQNDSEFETPEIFEFSITLKSKFDERVEKPCEKCLEVIFRDLHKILEALSVDIWMSLSECYFESESKTSMQELIGGKIYDICESLEDGKAPRDVFNCLCALKIKPKTESDKIAAASLEEIISEVEMKGEKVWFKALVRHSGFIESNALRTVMRNLTLADGDDVRVILDTTFAHIINSSPSGRGIVGQKETNNSRDLESSDQERTIEDAKNTRTICDTNNDDAVCSSETDEKLSECIKTDNLELSKKVFLTAVKMTTEYTLWLERVFQSNRVGLLVTENSNYELGVTINKLTKEEENIVVVSDLVCLCMQLPEPTLKELCSFAVYSEDVEHWVEVLKILKPACFVWSSLEKLNLLEDVLVFLATSGLGEKHRQSLASLVVRLGEENLIGERFFKYLLSVIKNGVEMKRFEEALHCLEILQRWLEADLVEGDRLPLVVFLSRVLGNLSWDLNTFSTVFADGRDLVDLMVGFLIKNLGTAEEARLQWARKEINLLEDIDQAYFCDLWFRFGKRWTGRGMRHSGLLALAHSALDDPDVELELRSLTKTHILFSLTRILPFLTFHKWLSLFNRILNNYVPEEDYYEILEVFANFQYLFAVTLNQDNTVYPCFEHSIRCLGRLVHTCLPKMTTESSAKTFKKILFTLNGIRDEKYRSDCTLVLLPVALELISKVKEGDEGEKWENEVWKVLEAFPVKEVLEATKKKLNVRKGRGDRTEMERKH